MMQRGFAVMCALLISSAGFGAGAEEQRPEPAEPSAAAAVPGSEKPQEPRPTWYALALAQGPGGFNVTNFWSKGAKFRAETTIGGHKIVTLVNGDWYYAYDATKRAGTKIRRASEAIAEDAPYRRPFGNEAIRLVQQGAEKIREESIHGVEAEVYQVTDRRGRRTIWVTKDAVNIPIRIEMYVRSTGMLQSTEFVNWLTGVVLGDAFFEPEPGIVFDVFELEEYLVRTAQIGGIGPVPVLYADLLRGSQY